jgi:phytoene dehydrogenase-like protein
VDALAKVVRDAGGELKVRSRVLQILIKGDRAEGVEVERPGSREIIHAREIYSDAGAETTYVKLLKGTVGKADELAGLCSSYAYGVVTLYLGLKSRCEHLGIYGQNFWMYDGFDHDATWDARNLLAKGKVSSCSLSFPGIKDPTAKRPTAEIIAPIDHRVFQRWNGTRWMKRGLDYAALKYKISEALIGFVERHIPGFSKEVAYSELSTPLSTQYFMGHREGGIYGFPGIPGRYDSRCLGPKTPLQGLALVGADAGGHGITGAMMGGFLGVASQHGLEVFVKVFKEG